MNGFYSIWSEPFLRQKKEKEYYMQDFERLTLLLSAEEWKKHNGPVQMIADQQAVAFLEMMGLLPVFNAGVEIMKVDKEINSEVFWAAGKLEALKRIQSPAVMLDLDLIVWKNLDEFLRNQDVCVIHQEPLRDEIYPGKDFFKMNSDYHFDSGLDWGVLPCNTSLLYIRDMELKAQYVFEAQRFMKNCVEEHENLCHMVFAEQRLLSMCTARAHQRITPFVQSMDELDFQQYFTHLWGHKNVLKFNYSEREKFCIRCLKRLKDDVPKAFDIASGWEDVQEYLEQV